MVQRVLVVDDHESNLLIVERYLESLGCDIATASSGLDALYRIAAEPPDLILLDVTMPEMDGLEVCRRIKEAPATRLIPIVMLTALNSTADRVAALEAGADDFMSKPVDRTELVVRVRSLLRLKELYDNLEDTEQVIYALARAVEAKDAYTDQHARRVADNARRLAQAVGIEGRELDLVYRGGLVHDIGKIGVPDAILAKPGRLTPDEWQIMTQHTIIGSQICGSLKSAPSLIEIVRHHHEAFDGSGYPAGLAGERIPLSARIVAICDAYDAMTSDRPYRPGRSPGEALKILSAESGRQWDPALVSSFLNVNPADSAKPVLAKTGRASSVPSRLSELGQ